MDSTEQKIKETIAELNEWLDKPTRKEEDYQKRIEEINEELKSEKLKKSIRLQFEYLDNWYSNNFVYELLTANHTNYKVDACANGYHNLVISDKLADIYPNNPPKLAFDKATYWIANCLSQKWYKESEILIEIINKGLDTKFLDGGWDIKIASWFILEIANNGFQKYIDLSVYNYPEDMGVYQKALNNWNTEDLALLDNIVSSLCDFHLNEASHGDLSDNAGKRDPMFLQFSSTKWFVYTFEILAWLSIREKTGLRNPEKFSHPLMNIELNKLAKENSSMPENELFEEVMSKLNS